MQPDSAFTFATFTNTNNRGIRDPEGIDHPLAQLIAENCDPTSGTYGQALGRQYDSSSWSAMPSTGFYIAGQFVKNNSVVESGTTPNKFTVLGWERLTTGTSHTLNTDWREMRCLTGN
jgi:hypothetical protein